MRETADSVSRAAAEPETTAGPLPGVAAPFAGVLALQRSAGNRATVRALGLSRRASKVLPFDQEIFTAKVGTEAVTYGQMLFHSMLGALVIPKAEAVVDQRAELGPVWKYWLASMAKGDWQGADAARQALRELAPDGPLAALHGPDDARLEAGGAIFEKLWKAYDKPGSGVPDLTPYATLSQYQALRRWELQACKATATRIAKRYIAAGGVGGARTATTAIKPTALVAGVKRDRTPTGGDTYRGDVATYSTKLADEVEKMRRALDDGWVVHARVLSGITGGGKSGAEAEHSLVIYGYDGDTFEFFDPDVAGSNLARSGFEKLYFDRAANRLSTARTEAQFGAYAAEGAAGSNHHHGWHAHGVHRYQVTSIETL
jgi:hypothetical protein